MGNRLVLVFMHWRVVFCVVIFAALVGIARLIPSVGLVAIALSIYPQIRPNHPQNEGRIR